MSHGSSTYWPMAASSALRMWSDAESGVNDVDSDIDDDVDCVLWLLDRLIVKSIFAFKLI
jgi:hypothetical protein